jgi:hypothetical protein
MMRENVFDCETEQRALHSLVMGGSALQAKIPQNEINSRDDEFLSDRCNYRAGEESCPKSSHGN